MRPREQPDRGIERGGEREGTVGGITSLDEASQSMRTVRLLAGVVPGVSPSQMVGGVERIGRGLSRVRGGSENSLGKEMNEN